MLLMERTLLASTAFLSSRVDSDKDVETGPFTFSVDEAWGPKEDLLLEIWRPLTIASAFCTMEAEATVPVFSLWPAKSMFW